jgi:hypothetical protein
MATREDLRVWLVSALKAQGGRSSVVEICKHVWENHHDELESSGDLFFTWQYDIRWIATSLRRMASSERLAHQIAGYGS